MVQNIQGICRVFEVLFSSFFIFFCRFGIILRCMGTGTSTGIKHFFKNLGFDTSGIRAIINNYLLNFFYFLAFIIHILLSIYQFKNNSFQ